MSTVLSGGEPSCRRSVASLPLSYHCSLHQHTTCAVPTLQAQAILKQLPALVDIDVPVDTHLTVCGDTHGQ